MDGKDHFVKLQGTTDEPYFCGKDVCAILGYVDIKKALQVHIKSKHKRELKEFEMVDDYNAGKAVYISKQGLEILVRKCRVCDRKTVKAMVTAFDLDLKLVCQTKEQEYIGAITNAFYYENFQKQYPIGPYRIDLYFPTLKIAVECDEFNHRDRNTSLEFTRQQYIETQLNCRFVRFNPDSKEFCIYRVIGDLARIMR